MYRDRLRDAIVMSAAAMLLIGAAGYEANRERLFGLPPDERERLLSNLRRFDLELTPEQQSAVRTLDAALDAMMPEQ